MMDTNLILNNLEEMQISDKIATVRGLVNKAKENEVYSTQVSLPEDFSEEEFYTYALNVADSAENLVSPSGIDNLLDAEKAEAYANLSSAMDFILMCFPEYKLQNSQLRSA